MAVRREERAAQAGARPGQGRDTGRSLDREEVAEDGVEVLGVEEHGQLLHQVGHHVPAVGGEAGDVLEVGEQAGQGPGAALAVDEEGGHQLPHRLLLQPGQGVSLLLQPPAPGQQGQHHLCHHLVVAVGELDLTRAGTEDRHRRHHTHIRGDT